MRSQGNAKKRKSFSINPEIFHRSELSQIWCAALQFHAIPGRIWKKVPFEQPQWPFRIGCAYKTDFAKSVICAKSYRSTNWTVTTTIRRFPIFSDHQTGGHRHRSQTGQAAASDHENHGRGADPVSTQGQPGRDGPGPALHQTLVGRGAQAHEQFAVSEHAAELPEGNYASCASWILTKWPVEVVLLKSKLLREGVEYEISICEKYISSGRRVTFSCCSEKATWRNWKICFRDQRHNEIHYVTVIPVQFRALLSTWQNTNCKK